MKRLALAAVLSVVCAAGCLNSRRDRSPVADGLNTRDLVDPPAQRAAEEMISGQDLVDTAQRLRKQSGIVQPATPRGNVLCLSGGGSYGAYSAGVLYGWTKRGDRPTFDTVTGISTGSLISPFAFLGPAYDEQMKEFYTTLRSKDLYKTKYVRGLWSDSFADNKGLAKKLDETLTPELVAAIACEHQKGRRLYVGTTELDGKRGVVWDIGAIACRGGQEARTLIRQVLLGSSAIPGFFPPSEIPVTVDGRQYIERHVDGGVSFSIFFRPPHDLPPLPGDPTGRSLAGVNVYNIVAGKLFVDPHVQKPRALGIAGNSVGATIYSQGRGDLVRIWTMCHLTGMNYFQTSIPDEYPAPLTSSDFDPEVMTGMFNEGVRQVCQGTAWRTTPPGVEPGEPPLERSWTDLTHIQRGRPVMTGPESRSPAIVPLSPEGIPVRPGPVSK